MPVTLNGSPVAELSLTLYLEERALAGFEEEEEMVATDRYGMMAADGLAIKALLSVVVASELDHGESYL